MRFSLEWILELCPGAPATDRIVEALTARGLTVDAVEGSGSGTVLDIDIPANRPDCLGHRGVARELAAAIGQTPANAPAEDPGEAPIRVEIDAPDLCPRYTARIVRSVRLTPSPPQVVQRLERCGLRSVNNVVDASNLVLLELGQPIHFFDLSKIAKDGSGAPMIRVHRAGEVKAMRTLDGIDRALQPDMLLIADAERPVALAGVIGGANSEIDEGTTDVLIEAASFHAPSIRATSRRLALQTDASFRFERGLDPEGPLPAQALAARLLQELAGGTPDAAILDVWPGRSEPKRLRLKLSEVERLLGYRPDPAETLRALEALSLVPSSDGDAVSVTIPSFRSDLEREADLVEEVARHLGYERIPATVTGLPAEIAEEEPPPSVEERARDLFSHLGFHESIGYAMIAEGEDAAFSDAGDAEPLRLSNPIAEPLTYMRRSVLPGLLQAMDLNLRRGTRDVRLFEVGHVFLGSSPGEFPREPLRLGLAWSGTGDPRHWSRGEREVDLFDVIGVVDQLLSTLWPGTGWTRAAGSRAAFHPARSVHWNAGDRTVAWAGSLHPEIQSGFDQPVLLAEVELTAPDAAPGAAQYHAVPRLPAVSRDLSLLLTRNLPYAELLQALRSVEPPAEVHFEATDRYQGPPLAPGQTSLTIRMTLQPRERTLTDPETESYRQALVETLQQSLGIEIRG